MPPKRLKPQSVLNPDLFSRTLELQASFRANTSPFAYVSIEALCEKESARAISLEARNIQATKKETDLFKVFQTGELQIMDEHNPEHVAKLGTLMRLRRELNSDQFRELIETVTGCGKLSGQVDLSANAYNQGKFVREKFLFFLVSSRIYVLRLCV